MTQSEMEPSIVVADDEQRYADAHARMLSGTHDVTAVYGGVPALETIDDGTDLVLLDRNMPDMEGDEVVQRLRDDGIDCPIIMVTAVEPDFDIIDLGFDDYIVKPTSEAELRECVETWVTEVTAEDTVREHFSLSAKWETLEEYKSDEEIEKRVLDSLHVATQELMQADDETEIAELATETAYTVLQFPGTELLTYEPTCETLVRRAVDGIATESDETQEHGIDQSPQGEAFLSQETLVYDSGDDVDLGPFDVAMYVPLGVHGVLGVGKTDSETFSDSEQKFTEILAGTVRVTLAQVRREQELAFLSDVLSRVLRHNVRNELQPVTGFAELLSDRLSGENLELVQIIQSQASSVIQKSEKARTVENVMKGEKTRTEIDITRVVEQSVKVAESRYPDATITTTLPEDAVATGLSTIGHSIDELVENAIVHSERETPTVDIRVTADQDTVTVQISDNGPGIPQSEIEMVRQQDEMDLSHGSGVGLYLANWIIERSGGSVSFETESPGTQVTVELSRRDRPYTDE